MGQINSMNWNEPDELDERKWTESRMNSMNSNDLEMNERIEVDELDDFQKYINLLIMNSLKTTYI